MNPADLAGIRVHMHDGLGRRRHGQRRIAAGGDVAEPRPGYQQQVAVLDQRRLRRRGDVADVGRHGRIEDVVTPEGNAGRQVVGCREGTDVVARLVVPATATDHQKRFLRLRQHLPHLLHLPGPRMGADGHVRPAVRRRRHVALHVLGKGNRHRPGSPRRRHVEGVVHDLGNAVGLFDLHRPLGRLREQAAVVHLLERFAVVAVPRHLPNQHHHGRGVLEAGVQPDRPVAGARTAGDDHYAGLAGKLAIRFCHVGGARLEPAGDDLHVVAMLIQAVEQGEIALARHAEDVVDPVYLEGIGKSLPAVAGVSSRRHDCLAW